MLVCALIIAIAMFGERIFGFLGDAVDGWRPTGDTQARPGHDHLGVGLVCAGGSLWVLVRYDVLGTDEHLWRQQALLPLLLAFIAGVLMPIAAVFAILRWKN